MKNTNIVALLKTFSRKEFNEFAAFISSPAQIRKRDVRKLFDTLKNHYPDFDRENLTDEKIFASLFPGKKIDKPKLSIAAFHLYDAACDFLVNSHAKNSKTQSMIALLEEFLNRGLRMQFEKLAKKLESELNPTAFSLSGYFENLYKFYDLLMTYHSRNQNFHEITFYYSRKTECITALFLLKRFRLSMNKVFMRDSYSAMPEESPLEKVLSQPATDSVFAEGKGNEFIELLRPVYSAAKCFEGEDPDRWIEEAVSSYYRNEAMYSREEKVYITREILNLYLSLIINETDSARRKLLYRKEFEFIKMLVDQQLCFSIKDKYVNLAMFRNIVFTAIENEEFDWAEQFITEYSEKLKPSLRTSMLNMSLAELEFERRNFEKSLGYLSVVKFESPILKNDVRFLQLKIYYELGYLEQAHYSHQNAVRIFRKKASSDPGDNSDYLNFLDFYLRLLKLSLSPDKYELNDAISELNKHDCDTESKSWLEEKFRALL